jgi:GTP-binding protein
MLIHVLDASGSEGRAPLDDFLTVQKEMTAYSEHLMQKPQLVALNKTDIADASSEDYLALISFLRKNNLKYFPISAATKLGVDELMKETAGMLAEIERDEAQNRGSRPLYSDQSEWMKVSRIEDDPDYRTVHIAQAEEDGAFVLTGKQLEKMVKSTNFNDPGSLNYLSKYLETNGIIRKLKARGLEEGGTIRINDFDMEYFDDER